MIEAILRRGTLVTVVVAMVLFFGGLAALRVPVQMIPDLNVRTVSVYTAWPGATPQDVEHLRSLPNLKRMTSHAGTGEASIELEFPFGTDISEALIRVNNALSQVPDYPENVDEPVLYTHSFSDNAFMGYRVVPLPGNPKGLDMDMMRDFVDDHVRPAMERVEGLAQVSIESGSDRQVQILVDPDSLAAHGLSLLQVRDAVRARNRDISGGDLNAGKRRYLLRTVGRFKDMTELEDLILIRRGDAVTRLKDVAKVRLDHFEIRARAYTNGEANIWISLYRESGSNVIAIKRELEPVIAEINQTILAPEGLQMLLSNDDVRYVQAAVSNVWQNLLLGGVLAAGVLLLFLRSWSATFIGICGIPICTIASFIALLMAGRTLNVISLAGIAFAIGMSVDNTIVVLESIERRRRQGLGRFQAALEGTREVWAATLASTLTTVLVFVPVLFVQEEAGQLFSDIAIAISASITFSMLVAVTVVPLATLHLPGQTQSPPDRGGSWLARLIAAMTRRPLARYACMIVTTAATGAALFWLTPPAEYLPEGEEAKSFSVMIAPPGYNLAEMEKLAQTLQADLLPCLDAEPGRFASGAAPFPALDRYHLIVEPESLLLIAETKDPGQIDTLIEAVDARFATYPGMRSFSSRGSIISSNDGGTRAVNLDISGPDLALIYEVAKATFDRAESVFEDPQINSEPSSLSLGQPLVTLRPVWERLAEAGLSTEEFGYAVAALTDGAYVDDFFVHDDKVDIYLYSDAVSGRQPQEIATLPIRTPGGAVVPLASLAEIRETVDSANIRRVNGKRTVTLQIIPPRSVPLETAVARVKEQVLGAMVAAGEIPAGMTVALSGASDQLEATRHALKWNFLIALVLCYLLLVVVYRHWAYPWIILITVPTGIAGGITGLWLLNFFGSRLPQWGVPAIQQPFDMITMLGFLILVGTVVNNPILIVDHTLLDFRTNGKSAEDAVSGAVATRIRPILISSITTLCGLAPLVFIPGAGTELYRGLGAIVLFGLAFSTVITLTFLPALLVTTLAVVEKVQKFRQRPVPFSEAESPA
jgi:multidrug efflux pump subunit AcrB